MTGPRATIFSLVLAATTLLAPVLHAQDALSQPGPEVRFMLIAIDGVPVAAPTTLSFQGPDRVGGRAPCNSWFAAFVGPFPDFALGPAGATRMACPELEQENAFFNALAAVTAASLEGPVLVLSNPAGLRMSFLQIPEN